METVSTVSSPASPNHNPTQPEESNAPLAGDLPGGSSSPLRPIRTNPTDNERDDPATIQPNTAPPSVPVQPQTLTPNSLHHVSFNQDTACFSTGTNQGFRIYNCDPFREIFRRNLLETETETGIAIVEMLFRCNILALVGGGSHPHYPPNKVMIWDDHQGRCIGELSFRSEVRGVRLRRDRIIVILEQKIFVYNFTDLQLLQQIETFGNVKGLCAVSQSQSVGGYVLVCLGLRKGEVRVEFNDSNDVKRTRFILAHDSRIACFGLGKDGNVVATASNKGTLVRVFSTRDGVLLQEVRRGADRAEIHSLAFSHKAEWLVVSSDKGTIHVFSVSGVDDTEHGVGGSPSSSPRALIKGVIPKYFSSVWSLAQFRLVEGCHYIAAFGHQKNTVVILGLDGSFYRCRFDPKLGGEMTQLEYHNFMKPNDSF